MNELIKAQEIVIESDRIPQVYYVKRPFLNQFANRVEASYVANALLRAASDPKVREGILLLAQGIGLEVER